MSHLAIALAIVSTLPMQAAPSPTAAPAPAAYVPPGAPTTPPTEDPDAKALATKFSAFIKCEEGRKDPNLHYCALTRIGQDPIWTPGQPVSYAGLSVFVKTGSDLKKSLAEQPTLAVLHLRPSSAKLLSLGATTTPDQKAAVTTIQKTLAGELKDPPVLPASVNGTWKNDAHGGRTMLKLDRLFADITTTPPVRLFRTDTIHGAVYVTLENQADGQRISVFPLAAGIQ